MAKKSISLKYINVGKNIYHNTKILGTKVPFICGIIIYGVALMKKWILNILIAIVSLILLISIVSYFNGSLEMYPTEEQIKKVRIISVVIGIISLISDMFLIRLRLKSSIIANC